MSIIANPVGEAIVLPVESGVRLVVRRGHARLYSNAQLDDYAGRPRSAFANRPPLTLALRARFSHDGWAGPSHGLQGTAGFGFWNDPFMMTDPRPPMLPSALWFFFASPPSDMKLAADVPGHGWKAATIDARRASATGAILAAPLLAPFMRFAPVYRRAWPPIQRRLAIAEALVPGAMTDWRRYAIEWGSGPRHDRTRFLVDGVLLLEAPAPRGPLGLVIWCDNQYMIVQPWGRLAHGLLATGEQWLEVADIELTRSVEG